MGNKTKRSRPKSGLLDGIGKAYHKLQQGRKEPPKQARIIKTERNQPLLVTAQGTPTPTLCNPPFAELPPIADRPEVTVEVPGSDAAVVNALERHGFPNPTFPFTSVSL